jgi:hypothetical protein
MPNRQNRQLPICCPNRCATTTFAIACTVGDMP